MTADSAAPTQPPARVTLRAVLTVFLPFAGGYYLSYLYRSINAIIADHLVADVGLSASGLGLLTSAYFLAFAAFQIPLGLLLDRFGPRRVQATLLLSAALGAFVFSRGDSEPLLILGRALIGLGVAGGLMASFKAITLWFPEARWPLVNGCFLATGGLGAMSATAPVEALLQVTDWRGLFAGLSLATLGVSLAIVLAVPERGTGGGSRGLGEQLRGLRYVYTDRLFWRMAPMAMAAMAASMSIQGLWAGPWLRDVAGFDRAGVAGALLALSGSLTVGFVLGGTLADLLGRLGIPLIRVMGGGLLAFMTAQAAIVLRLDPAGLWPWLLFGLTGNITALAYAQLSRHFPLAYSGRANTALNVLVFLGAFAAQYAMGGIIDLWPETARGGYPEPAYQAAFGTFLGLEVLAFAWFALGGRRRA